MKRTDWYVLDAAGRPVEPSDFVKRFDYTTPFTLGCRVEVEVPGLFAFAGLADDAEVGLCLTLDCPASSYRQTAVKELAEFTGLDVRIAVPVPPGVVASAVTARCAVVLVAPGTPEEALAAATKGSRLLELEPFKLQLEGVASRFPLQAASFSSLYLPSAPWIVMVDFEEPADSFMGSVQLLINSEHPAGQLALSPESSPSAAFARSALRTDIVRQLILRISTDGRFVTLGGDDEDSLIGVVKQMCREILGRELSEILDDVRNDPVSFEQLVADRTGYLNVGV